MSNPNTAVLWLLGVVCALPLIAFMAGVFLASAFHKGWIVFKVDRSKAPRLGRRISNDER